MEIRLQDIMRKPTLIEDTATFYDALKKMICSSTNCLLVVDRDGHLAGLVQALELIKRVRPGYLAADAIAAHFATEEIFREACEAARDVPLDQIMNPSPKTVTLKGSLMEAAVIAIAHDQPRIPVVDGEHRPIGLLSRTELKQVIGKFLGIEECFMDPKAQLAGGPPGQASAGPLSRILIPIDGSPASRRAVKFAGCLAAQLGGRTRGITLLHVLADSHFRRHLADMATVRVKGTVFRSDIFRRSRQEYISTKVEPFLAEAEDILRCLGAACPVERLMLDGVPAEQILKTSTRQGHSTIIMGRRGLTPVKEILLGSVTASLLHQPKHPSVYVTGNRTTVLEADTCPVPRILVPVDGSEHAYAAVQEAGVLGSGTGEKLMEIVLLRAMDLVRYAERDSAGATPESEAEDILERARRILIEAGVNSAKIITFAAYGSPLEVIMNVAMDRQPTLILMGRRGRSSIQEFFMGSVSREVMERCVDPTIGMICLA